MSLRSGKGPVGRNAERSAGVAMDTFAIPAYWPICDMEELSKDGTATVCANRTMKPPDSRRFHFHRGPAARPR